MESISVDQFDEYLFREPAQEIRKLELRDHYDVDHTLFEAWRVGDRSVLDRIISEIRADSKEWADRGFGYRRVRVISEPLSEYQRMAIEIANPDEQLRWLPRSKASTILLPGNDCLLRNDLLIFNLIGGSNESAGFQLSTDPAEIKLCNDAFEQAWSLGIANGDYGP